MADSREPILKKMLRGFSHLLLLAGGVVFLFGDKFLHEIEHLSFLSLEVCGILEVGASCAP
jgi:hypothetical protein